MLRPESIAIDGPAGSGKSTVGEQLAARLGYLYVDTGAMYRAVTWLALRNGIDITNGPALATLAQQAEIAIGQPQVADGRQYTVTTRGEDITWAIRTPEVTGAVSTVSAHPAVRATLIAQQRAIAEQVLVVMVGRDIGAIVLPNAHHKLYLTASLAERAHRRYTELVQRLGSTHPDLPILTDVMRDIERRDQADREQMQPAQDAIIIETDHLSIAQVLAEVYRHIEEHL